MVNTRWSPTPEQLQALKEMYHHGTRTPTAQQIQQIASRLRRFGKIEGKNVFYWFQNHKARDRQKRLRQTSKEISVLKESAGLGRTTFEVGQTENWATLSKSSTLSEESLSLQQGAVVSECKIDEREWQQRSSMKRTLATHIALQMEMSSIPFTDSTETLGTRGRKISTKTRNPNDKVVLNIDDERRRDSQTLQLFPICRDDHNNTIAIAKNDADLPIAARMVTTVAPIQIFEFFPLNLEREKEESKVLVAQS